jgi:hypothetical protein
VWLSAFENTAAFRSAATYCPKPGLTSAGQVSFESYQTPGSYLRHSDYLLKVNPWDGTQTFRGDASFSVVAPLELFHSYLPSLMR